MLDYLHGVFLNDPKKGQIIISGIGIVIAALAQGGVAWISIIKQNKINNVASRHFVINKRQDWLGVLVEDVSLYCISAQSLAFYGSGLLFSYSVSKTPIPHEKIGELASKLREVSLLKYKIIFRMSLERDSSKAVIQSIEDVYDSLKLVANLDKPGLKEIPNFNKVLEKLQKDFENHLSDEWSSAKLDINL